MNSISNKFLIGAVVCIFIISGCHIKTKPIELQETYLAQYILDSTEESIDIIEEFWILKKEEKRVNRKQIFMGTNYYSLYYVPFHIPHNVKYCCQDTLNILNSDLQKMESIDWVEASEFDDAFGKKFNLPNCNLSIFALKQDVFCYCGNTYSLMESDVVKNFSYPYRKIKTRKLSNYEKKTFKRNKKNLRNIIDSIK